MELFGIMMAIFAATLFLGMPIAICIGLSVAGVLWLDDVPIAFISQLAFSGLDNFTYLAIPMFILAGYVMETGGLSRRLIQFAASLVGNITGGLGIVTVLACMFFAAISGSSPATVAAIGTMMVPSMIKKGYNPHFSSAIAATSGSLGILIPPSIPMIIFAVTAEVSIGEIFMAGFIPGAMIGAGLIAVVYIISKKNGYKEKDASFNLANVWLTFKEAIWALLTPLIILGGIYSGIFTPTEAAVVAVLYALFASLVIYKELKLKDLPAILSKAAVTTGTVIIILGFATAFARYLTLNQVPQMLGKLILSITNDPTTILLMFIVLVFITGMFIETAAQILIYTPLFLPILVDLGVSPIHFGIILVIGTELGLITPPVGVNLFVAQGIAGSTIGQLTKKVLPFLVSMLVIQLILTLFPEIVLFLPNMMYGK